MKNQKKNNDKYISKIKYQDSDLIIQTPKVYAVKTPENTLEIKIKSDSFYNFLGSFDESIVKTLELKAKEWFSQDLNSEQCQEIYKRSIHLPFKSDGSPRMFLKLTDTSIYNKSKDILDKNSIHENEEIICLIKCSHLYFYRSYCIPCWEAVQIKIKDTKLNTDEYIIKDKPEDEISYEQEIDSIPEFPQLNIDLKE